MKYKVHGCKLFQDAIEEVSDKDAEFFGVYRIKGSELSWVSDHPSREKAENAITRL